MFDWIDNNLAVLVIGGFLFVDTIILSVGLLWVQTRITRVRAAYKQVADQTGLTLHEGSIFFLPPRLAGDYRGRPAAINLIERRSGTTTNVQLRVQNPDALRLRLWPEGVLAALSKIIGGKDIRTGDESFDRRYMIQSDDPDGARRVLGDTGLREKLLRLAGDFSLNLNSDELLYHHHDRLLDPARLIAALDTLSDLADRVEDSGPRSKL